MPCHSCHIYGIGGAKRWGWGRFKVITWGSKLQRWEPGFMGGGILTM